MHKVIRDPIHGYIEIDDLAIAILETVELQRLRRIRQLGFSYLVYPGANHTRFEHSLGTYHLMNVLLDKLAVKKEEEAELRVASLIHDIGHGPYSHVTEPLIRTFTGKSHEDIEEMLFVHELQRSDAEDRSLHIAEVLEDYCLDTHKIQGHIKNTGEGGGKDFAKILNGEIDVDKMDYLVRDSYYTGVAYGVLDNMRLIQGLDFFEGQLVITEKGILPAEYLLFSRFLMYPTVYRHHTSRIARLMFARAVEHYINTKTSALEYALALREMDDFELDVTLRSAEGYPKEMMARINERRLFKRAVYTGINVLEAHVVEELDAEDRVKELEHEISIKAGIDEKYVIIDFQGAEEESLKESDARVLIRDEQSTRSLREVSELVSMLSRVFWEKCKLGVYTPGKYRAAVKKAAESVLWR
ncbi:MAG: HD domain-containing protein [Methanophagales archaeon]|nr:HD domain-containing protein [Methanophagales archaeon]